MAATQAHPSPQRKLTSAEELSCGVAGGLGKVFTGHPFDTVKGRVQSGAYPTAMSALRATVRDEGPRALYQGVLPPCISVGLVSGVLFSVNAQIRARLQSDPSKPLTYSQMAIAGAGAGAVTAVILTPLDQMKIWLQVENRARVQQAAPAASSTGPSSASATPSSSAAASSSGKGTFAGHMRRTMLNIGGPQLYRGFSATTLREMGTFGIFFPLNEYCKGFIAGSIGHDISRDGALPIPYRLAAAGFSGVMCWLPCYPIDQIKTRQQLQGHPQLTETRVPAGSGRNMVTVAGDIFREEGLRGFSRGITPCLLRAFPTYAAQFVIFDTLTGYLRQQ